MMKHEVDLIPLIRQAIHDDVQVFIQKEVSAHVVLCGCRLYLIAALVRAVPLVACSPHAQSPEAKAHQHPEHHDVHA